MFSKVDGIASSLVTGNLVGTSTTTYSFDETLNDG